MVSIMSRIIPAVKEAEWDDPRDDESELVYYWQLPRAFTEKRHTEKIEAFQTATQPWRMKERMKTVSVALVMCLNVGVDPPDVVKISPCARLECWVDPYMYVDPFAANNQKAVEIVGASLQHQYERWQPRARYKLSLDPTVDDVRKLCISLRRNAKDERVLFHYNGHGVPRPTANGEVWVFNKQFTQYIPLAICDLHVWMGYPSIYVFDCSSAGSIVDYVRKNMQSIVTARDQQEVQVPDAPPKVTNGVPDVMSDVVSSSNDCIQLASCQANELLPMNPELPADLFTSCLTTPIKIALRWFVLQKSSKLVPDITLDLVDKVQGLLNDRRTMLGELNWIFTAITDTVAWNVLPRDVFQKLFRQDLLVASLFRNFLLAERIMRSYNCNPVSSPRLPPTFQHPMWQAWDLALDHCLAQLPRVLEDNSTFEHSPFFAEQLTAFQVWLTHGSEKRSPPEQLPIVLQVLLSQVHRQRALELLGRFLDLGPWAVNLALSVGIFPYVLKLLQSSARELRPLLVFIWAKLLAVDSVRNDLASCQADLIKDSGHKYFLSVLSDQYMPAEHRTMAAFILTMIVHNNPTGQEVGVQGNIIALCLEQLIDPYPLLRQWLALCLGKVWTKYDSARWCGVRDSAHEKLYPLLTDETPEVRAAVVFALGTFVNNSAERGEHANSIDHGVATKLLTVLHDGSPLVRKELVVALSGFVSQFETQFAAVAFQFSEAEKEREYHTVTGTVGVWNSPNEAAFMGGMRRSVSSRCLTGMLSPLSAVAASDAFDQTSGSVKRIASTSSMMSTVLSSYSGIYTNVWKVLLSLSVDPSPAVSDMARKLSTYIRHRASYTTSQPQRLIQQQRSRGSVPISAPSSPSNRPGSFMPKQTQANEPLVKAESPEASRPMTLKLDTALTTTPLRASFCATNGAATVATATAVPQYMRHRMSIASDSISEKDEEAPGALLSTEFFEWCCKYFTLPVMSSSPENDPHGAARYEHDYRFYRAAQAKRAALDEQCRAKGSRIDESIFINRCIGVPGVLRFHPCEPHLIVADKDHISIWDWEQGTKLSTFSVRNPRHTRVTQAEFINTHDQALILTGSDDGYVKVWRNYYSDAGLAAPDMVTAWQALTDMLPIPKGSGLVLNWDQSTGLMYASGDARVIRIWDMQKELRIQDLPTNADTCITNLSLTTFNNSSLLVGGCGDGTVRVFDKRLPPNESTVQIFHEHQSWVVKAYTVESYPNRVISASINGDVRLWDIRGRESFKVINTSAGLTALDAHQHADIIACGSVHQYIAVYNFAGETLSMVKHHEGFMGQRIGPVTCLAFHPLKVRLAVGSEDQFVSIYSISRKR